ncbi:TetR/AcrR family transcriptional regulator [Kineosporia mesophila]|uniref:TetR/AcrR family transcriptional regulator n=1 Tax=Kineosporia mesophila TaxID=566012 RepID=A0ABP6ZLN6_9ACTN|nr:TetR/AcrR family transcriptional regulator [Kineosporia mesophila]MCD5349595.1 TetR/AcrR family transcriptional regulator [Kineosporia mesophila]
MTLEQTVGREERRPLRADAERNRRRILAAAAEVFAERGLDAGLDEIARRAGVGTGTVYRRFPDKSSLIEALFVSRVEALVELTEQARDAPDAWTGLVTLITRSVEMQIADRGLKELLFGDVSVAASMQAQVVEKVARIRPTVAAILAQAKAEGAVRQDVSVTDLAVTQFMLHGVGKFSTPDAWRRQLALVLAGLRPDNSTLPLPGVPLSDQQLLQICAPDCVGPPGHLSVVPD